MSVSTSIINVKAQEISDEFKFAGHSSKADIPFDLYLNLIFLQVRVDNSEPLVFILDSGFEESVLNKSTADKLGLKTSADRTEEAPGGEIELSYTDSITFNLTGVDIFENRVAVVPLDQLTQIIGRHFDGIIGHDLFARFVVELDYENKNAILYDPADYSKSNEGICVPVTVENNEAFVFAVLKDENRGNVTAKLKLDTGSVDFTGFNGSFVQAESLFTGSQKKLPALGAAVGGNTENFVTRLNEFSISDIKIENPVVGYSVDTLRGGDAGTLGGEFLSRFTVIFDYPHGEICFRQNGHFGEPYEYDMSGIFPIAEMPDFKTIMVISISDKSPAAEAGMLPGDIIDKIDGHPAGDYSIEVIRRMFVEDGKTYNLEVLRGNETLEIEITLRRLI